MGLFSSNKKQSKAKSLTFDVALAPYISSRDLMSDGDIREGLEAGNKLIEMLEALRNKYANNNELNTLSQLMIRYKGYTITRRDKALKLETKLDQLARLQSAKGHIDAVYKAFQDYGLNDLVEYSICDLVIETMADKYLY